MITEVKSFYNLFESHTQNEPLKTEELISGLNAALDERRFHQITSKTHSFWLLYCKAFAQMQAGTCDFFVVDHEAQLVEETGSALGNCTCILSETENPVKIGDYFPAYLTIEGKPYVIRKIQRFIEQLRFLFHKHSNSFTPLFISLARVGSEYHLKETQDLLDCRDWEMHTGIPDEYFENYIEPVLPLLSRMLDMSMSPITYKKQRVRLADQFTCQMNSKVFTIIPYSHSY